MSASFEFAGFTFPRHIPRLVPLDYCGLPAPLARMQDRLRHPDALDVRLPSHQFKVSTGYSAAPTPGATGASYYLESDFMPGLRWEWADDVGDVPLINHTGWFSDADGAADKIRGVVFRLPKGRGFLAGWSMGESMASSVEFEIYESDIEAARAADSLAEKIAETERERDQIWQAGSRWASLGEEVGAARKRALAMLAERRNVSRLNQWDAPTLCAVIVEKIESLVEEIREARAERDRLKAAVWREHFEAFNEGAGESVFPT